MCRQLEHNSGRLSGGVTADYVLQLKGSANDEPKVSTRAARPCEGGAEHVGKHPERHAVSQRQAAPANVPPPVEPTRLHCVTARGPVRYLCAADTEGGVTEHSWPEPYPSHWVGPDD